MTSYNELREFIAKSTIANGLLDRGGEIAQASGGDLFIRIGAQVFKIAVEEMNQISQHHDPMAQEKLFMSTLPYPYAQE
ncbi:MULTISPECIES: hypothetical protein [Rhizobium/Agrobacterium group]|uniref:hypothetical protein n=1 Tax=Rhizobium/Agrobacterium group TaxID=227290 RepID=UPI0008DBEB95|nr:MULTISPECIES: hypothetical protein [Rhizobium/Agrobacterium group]MCF1436773.1 hypothetical protein [Allorhizobium ampelinum]MCF1464931.1 hypothetical protein [Allorhizobium ampelinum]MCF1495962.1 hypothetical protein [Allorhizobium ampelinum]MUO92142.1 hypothetical protein [Agrobacterium vitis]MUZ55462.1 hypothetical protein [Agrobacterium vitis]